MTYFLPTEKGAVELKRFDPSIHVAKDQLAADGGGTVEEGDVIAAGKNISGIIKHSRLSVDGQIYVGS